MDLDITKWSAVYYPDPFIEDRRTLTTMSLLFDQIICHSVCSDMACGGGSGMMGDMWHDDGGELVDAGVVLLDEQVLDPNIGFQYYESDFDTFYLMQVTAVVVNTVREKRAIPVASQSAWPIPAAVLAAPDFASDAQGQAVALATECLSLVLPRFAALSNEDILEAREKLAEHLVPFRSSMLQLAPALRSALDARAGADEVRAEARYIVETTVAPVVLEIERRIERENSRFWRRLLMKGGSILPKLVINWATKGGIAAAVESIATCSALAVEGINQEAFLDSLMQDGAIGYLLAVSELNDGKARGAE